MAAFMAEWERPDFASVPELAQDAAYLLRGCDDTTLRKTLQAVYRDFCKRSGAMRTWRKAMPERESGLVPVVPVLSGEIDCVTAVVVGETGRELRGWRVMGDPPVLDVGWRWRPHLIVSPPAADFGVRLAQEQMNAGAVPVAEKRRAEVGRDARTGLWIEAVEVPRLDEERAPRAFLRRYGDALVDGALARLMSMSNRPWTDGEQARQHGAAYANALSEARLRGAGGSPAANAGQVFALDFSGMV